MAKIKIEFLLKFTVLLLLILFSFIVFRNFVYFYQSPNWVVPFSEKNLILKTPIDMQFFYDPFFRMMGMYVNSEKRYFTDLIFENIQELSDYYSTMFELEISSFEKIQIKEVLEPCKQPILYYDIIKSNFRKLECLYE